MRYLRIHGDNIVECERTLSFLKEALHPVKISLLSGWPIYEPHYELSTDDSESFHVELLAGYDRWGFRLTDEILQQGGLLKETPDSYLSEVVGQKETVLLAIEYSSALPAGNNAWQRNGRGYSCAMAGIPYLYVTEIGGVELDSKTREVKAPRFPNPLVPFSYVAVSKRLNICCLPAYRPHPAITEALLNEYSNLLEDGECDGIIRGVLFHEDISAYTDSLCEKAMRLVEKRSSNGSYNGKEWTDFICAGQPYEWICQNKSALTWKRSMSEKVETTKVFKNFRADISALHTLAVGSKDMPFCLIPCSELATFAAILRKHYPMASIPTLLDKPLVVVWITGFKPKGEDSRPDRGLNPLVRMIVGEDAALLSIVSGPAQTPVTASSANDNGLWASVLKCSDYVLQDSSRISQPVFMQGLHKRNIKGTPPSFAYVEAHLQEIGEHDVDTTIHQFFNSRVDLNIFEGLCNPPDGDWSGISYIGRRHTEYRWTSLPRVSADKGKRPDHLIQVIGRCKSLLLTIESKGKASDLEKEIGKRLKCYISVLFATPVNARRRHGNWDTNVDSVAETGKYENFSVGAFVYSSRIDLHKVLETNGLDVVMAFEYTTPKDTKLHLCCDKKADVVEKLIKKIARRTNNIIVKID